MDCSTRKLTEGLATSPRFVLMIITPLAPRTPYMALAEASFSTENDSISAGSMSLRLRSTPSINTKGLLPLPKVEIPRIQKLESSYPGSPDGFTAMMPANWPARLLLSEREEPTCRSLGWTVWMEPTTERRFCEAKPVTTSSCSSFLSSFITTLKLISLPTVISCFLKPT